MNFWEISNGDIRFSSKYIKKLGLPYQASKNFYNGYESLNFESLVTWYQCKIYKLKMTEPLEAVAFRYIQNIGVNHYEGLYERKEIIGIRKKEKEEKRRIEIIQEMETREKVFKKKRYSHTL
jgi:hypothetical protein